MLIIQPSVTEVIQENGLDGIYKAIETAGRNCYKSEGLTKEGSAKQFVENLQKRQHYSPCEFGTVYLTIESSECEYNPDGIYEFYSNNKYSKVCMPDFSLEKPFHIFITTNLRVLIENNRLDDLQYLSEPTEFHAKRRFFRLICDRGVMAEVTRHRPFSFCIESTRYCSYDKDKFNNQITVIEPFYWLKNSPNYYEWKVACEDAEKSYMKLLQNGATPEQARAVLPNSLKTDICMCGFEDDWEHFFDLRCSTKAHPQMREVALMIKDLWEKNNG